MTYFQYRNSTLYAEHVAVQEIVEMYGTPCFIYSKASLIQNFRAYTDALTDMPHLICFGTKANPNIAILNILANEGAGFDIVSIGELERVIAAGGDPKKIVFSGVGKQKHELIRALEVGIHCFNVESTAELEQLNCIACELGTVAPISLRINPDIDPKTHPYISTGLKANKFGISAKEAVSAYLRAASLPGLKPIGIDCHIGSQLIDIHPLLEALDKLLELIDELNEHNIVLEHIDLGGGLGVTYEDENPPHPSVYMHAIRDRIENRELTLILEPGRSITANAGIFVSQTILTKTTQEKHFAVVDGAMNDLIRPSLYDAWHRIIPISIKSSPKENEKTFDIVGPVCETGDFLGKERKMCLTAGDLIAVQSAGAYGFAMASNYNTRPKPPEILVDQGKVHLIRRREVLNSLWQLEQVITT